MPTSSDYSCASSYSYHDQSPAPVSPRTARMQLLAGTDSAMSPESVSHRMSLASGPKVRHFEPVSWDDNPTCSRTSTMTGLSSKVKDVVTRRGNKEREKETLQADALHRQLSVLSSSATSSTTFSDASSAHLQTVISRRYFESASAVSIALSSASASSYNSSRQIHTPHKSPTLLEPFEPSVNECDAYTIRDYTPADESRATPRASVVRRHRPTISQPYSLAVLSSPVNKHPEMPMPSAHRPIGASASPGFSLISLADAQQREKDRAAYRGAPPPRPEQRPIEPTSPQSHRLKGKKSGIMKFLNKTPRAKRPGEKRDISSPEPYNIPPPLPQQAQAANNNESETDDLQLGAGLLQLRPVSMNISRHFPDQYLAFASPPPSPGPTQGATNDLEKERLARIEAERRFTNAQKAHMLQVYELEGQIRELKLQLAADPQYSGSSCENCGHERGNKLSSGIMNRARVKTAGPRGVFGSGSLYEAK